MLVGRTGLSPVMVGREVELDRLAGLIGARRVPTVALVSGEAGIGKTRLVQELVGRVPEGALVLTGQAEPGTVGRPMELLLDAIDAVVGPVTGASGPPLQVGDELVTAVRDAGRPAEERVRLGVDLVRHLAEGRTGVVVFEDLHWADSESVAVFERLAEPEPGDLREDGNRPGGGLVLVGTYRPDGLSRRHPASEVLPRLDRRHSVTHIHLERLTPAEVSRYLAAVYDEEPSFRVVDTLHGRTGGNPFFLEELVTTARERPQRELAAMPLPWTVSELVLSELDELEPEVRDMVRAASVLGRRVPFDLLASVTGATEAELIQRLRAAVDQGLLVEADLDVFTFDHELGREAIAGGLLGRERRRLHEAALDALRAAGSRDHVALAHHAKGAGRYDDLVDEARLGAHESLALGSSYQALQLAEAGLDEAEDDLGLLAVAARAAWLAGLLDDAAGYADRWLVLSRAADDVSTEARARVVRMRVAFELGDMDGMVAFADALIGVMDRLPTDEERARAMAAVAQSYMLRDLPTETAEWADKAMALADALDLADVRAAAMVEKGSMLVHDSSRSEESHELLERGADEAARAGEHVLAARALNNLVWHARRWSDTAEVRALIERMRVHAEAAGFDAVAVTDVAGSLAHLAATEGDLAAAIDHLDAARDTATGWAGWAKGRWIAVFRAGLAIEAGDLETAARFTEMAKPVTTRTAMGVIGLDFNLACRRGNLPAARALLADLLAAADREDFASPSQASDLLAAAFAAGLRADEMRPLADRAGNYVGHRLPADSGWRHLLGAQLAEAEGDTAQAAARFVQAADCLGHAPDIMAGHRGTAHVGAAANLILLDRLDEARAHAAEARRHLARWAGWRLDQLRAVERRLGMGSEAAGPAALTPREREVVALLAEGLTNSQLAERLYISPRTAAVHVSNILSKLGMSSRTEAAAWAVRTGATTG